MLSGFEIKIEYVMSTSRTRRICWTSQAILHQYNPSSGKKLSSQLWEHGNQLGKLGENCKQ